MVQLTESYWPAETGEQLLDTTIGDLLRRVATEVPDRVALVDGSPNQTARRSWTYAELLESAEAVARALLARLRPGERLAVWAPNCPEWVLLQQGASLAGLILVPVNPAFRTRELEYVLRQSQASGLFFAPEYRGTDLAAIVDELRPGLPGLRETWSFSEWGRFVEPAGASVELPATHPGDTVQFQYTSGTTGFPKGARLHHRGVVNASRFVAQRAGVADRDVWINAMPMFHIAGVLCQLGTIAQRGTFVLLPGFDPGLMLEAFETHRGTITLAVPTMLIAMLEHQDRVGRDLSSMRTVMSGAATVPAALVRRVRKEFGCRFTILFGQTELQGVVTQTALDDTPEDQSGTVGQPLPQVEVKVADPVTGDVLPPNVQGEICARGYQTMLGYFDMPEETAATLWSDGWLHTGDLGVMDARGYLRVTGRLKDMIIRGGMNIYPREIEEMLLEHPGVAEAVVLGLPDERWGERIAAVIRPTSPAEPPSTAALHDHCRAHLAAHKTPAMWFLVEAYPLTPSGKVRKFVIREWIETGAITALDIPAVECPVPAPASGPARV
jgi:fatty-acyl-CoA synthase